MTALLRSITLFTAIALLVFVGLHAVIPHEHPHAGGAHFSEIPPVAHSDNKIFILLVLVALMSFIRDIFRDIFSTLLQRDTLVLATLHKRYRLSAGMVPVRYGEALRKGRIHSRAH